jgi:hypothetical protein
MSNSGERSNMALSMKTRLPILLLAMALMACLATPGPGPVIWGAANAGLQCGLVAPLQSSRPWRLVELQVRNVGASPIALYDDEFHTAANGFSVTKAGNKAAPVGRFNMEAGSEIYVVGQRQRTTLASGGLTTRTYSFTLPKEAAGAYSVSFSGSLSVGASSAAVKCGPVTFSL